MRRHPHTIRREQRAMARARRALRHRPGTPASAVDFRNDKIGAADVPPDTGGTRSTAPHGQAPDPEDTGRDSDD